MIRLRAIAIALFAFLLAKAPRAHACAVCMSGREEDSQLAFILTTIFMSVLPLAMIGGIAWFVWRRIREGETRSRDTRLPADALEASRTS